MLTLAVFLALAGCLIAVWGRAVKELSAPPPPAPPIGQPQALVWGDHVFTSDRQLKRFLTRHGISYAEWASLHPAAFAVVRKQLVPRATSTSRSATPRKSAAQATSPRPRKADGIEPQRSEGVTRTGASRWTIWLTLALALATAVGLSGLLPQAMSPPLLRRAYRLPQHRFYAAAAASTVVVSLVIAVYLQ